MERKQALQKVLSGRAGNVVLEPTSAVGYSNCVLSYSAIPEFKLWWFPQQQNCSRSNFNISEVDWSTSRHFYDYKMDKNQQCITKQDLYMNIPASCVVTLIRELNTPVAIV